MNEVWFDCNWSVDEQHLECGRTAFGVWTDCI